MYKLKSVRVGKGMTQKELAKRIGVGNVYLSLIENEKVDIKKSLMVKISKELDTPVVDLFDF